MIPDNMLFPILVLSVLLNVILLTLIGYKLYRRYFMHGNRNFPRAEVFSKLPPNTGEIIFLGDSLTDHFEVSELFKDAGIINRGIAGNTTSDIIERLAEVTSRKPSKVFMMIGVNDFTYGVKVDQILENYRQIIQSIKKESPHTKIYFQTILPYRVRDKKIQRINPRLEALCKSELIFYIDLYSAFEQGGALHKKYDCGDGLHLNGAGYLLWRDLISSYVKE